MLIFTRTMNIWKNEILVRTYDSLSLDREIEFLGNQPVRQVATGCGSSSGFSKNNSGARSNGSVFSGALIIADFGTSQEWFTCPKCGYEADGHVNHFGLVPKSAILNAPEKTL